MPSLTRTRRITIAAALAALTLVTTWFVQIPIPRTGGYLNLGDAVITLMAYMLGAPYAAASAAVGSALADLLSGYVVYAPATAIIKAAMSLIAWAVIRRGGHESVRAYLIASALAGIVMVLGYFAYETCLFGASYAVVGLVNNPIQTAASVVLSATIYPVAKPLRRVASI